MVRAASGAVFSWQTL